MAHPESPRHHRAATGRPYDIDATLKGGPALWEAGGATTSYGRAQIIAGPAWERLKPLYRRHRGHRAGGEHALHVLAPGMHILVADWARRDGPAHVVAYRVCVLRHLVPEEEPHPGLLRALGPRQGAPWVAEVEPVAIPDTGLGAEAAEAAARKAACYHCRHMHWGTEA